MLDGYFDGPVRIQGHRCQNSRRLIEALTFEATHLEQCVSRQPFPSIEFEIYFLYPLKFLLLVRLDKLVNQLIEVGVLSEV